MIQNLLDLRALSNECDQAHLPTADRAWQWENLVGAGDHPPVTAALSGEVGVSTPK